jgi:cyclopropane fatty-acyl-phospholipid synthase-like methyltransferase
MSTSDERRSMVSAVLEMVQAYRQSAIITAAYQLKVFTHLANGPLSAETLAARCGVPVRGLRRLLNACVVVKLLDKKEGDYSNSPVADALLVEGKRDYMGSFAVRHAENYRAWGELAQAIRQDGPVDLHLADALEELPAERSQNYIHSLYDTGKRSAEAIAEKLDLSRARRMLDVGGGSGIYSIVLAQRHPALRPIVFDIPTTLSITKEVIARYGMEDRVSVRAGDFLHNDFGVGYDIVLLSNVLNMQGPKIIRLLLRKAFDALAPGGRLIINGSMPNADRVSPSEPALRQVLMFLMYPEGDAHPAEEVRDWAGKVGFIDLDIIRFPPPNYRCLVTGHRPA